MRAKIWIALAELVKIAISFAIVSANYTSNIELIYKKKILTSIK
jgi:hypothetical protein